VDGQVWPAQDGETLWLPAGPHAVEASVESADFRLVQLNGELKAVSTPSPKALEFTYQSGSRAIAILSRKPLTLQIDGVDQAIGARTGVTLLLPRGQHVVTLTCD
jgi:hypothetical protein